MKFGKFKWGDDPKLVKALNQFRDKIPAPFKLVEVFIPSNTKRRETIK